MEKKIVLVGSAGCGKTAFVHRLVTNNFVSEYQQTFGADYVVKILSDKSENRKATFQIWCTGGHERYRPLLQQFYANTYAAFLCFDMLSADSFEELPFWYNEIKRTAPDALMVLIGMKFDDADNIVIKVQDAIKQAKEWGIEFKPVSSGNQRDKAREKNAKKDADKKGERKDGLKASKAKEHDAEVMRQKQAAKAAAAAAGASGQSATSETGKK